MITLPIGLILTIFIIISIVFLAIYQNRFNDGYNRGYESALKKFKVDEYVKCGKCKYFEFEYDFLTNKGTGYCHYDKNCESIITHNCAPYCRVYKEKKD